MLVSPRRRLTPWGWDYKGHAASDPQVKCGLETTKISPNTFSWPAKPLEAVCDIDASREAVSNVSSRV